jgi:hypothetical protein
MSAVGEKQKESIHPTFDKSIQIDYQGAKITSDTRFLLMQEVDGRFRLLERSASQIEDPRSPRHTDYSLLQLLRQRVYQVAAGYEDYNVTASRIMEFEANQARLFVGCLACNLLHMIRDTAFWGKSVKPSIDSVISRLVKVGARVVCHTSRSLGYFHVASAFPNLHAPRGVEFSPEPPQHHEGRGSSASTAGKGVS